MDAQFKKGILDLCVLAVISRKEVYGYGLKMELSKVLAISENTLYPLLRRLKNDGFLTTYAVMTEQGHTRRYYRITEAGRRHFEEQKAEWNEWVQAVQLIINGKDDEDEKTSEESL